MPWNFWNLQRNVIPSVNIRTGRWKRRSSVSYTHLDVYKRQQIVRFLRTRQVKAIVVACNTASAYALETLQQESDIPIIGVVKPGARVAAKESPGGNIGVIGTAGTVGSHIYREYIQSLRPEAQVFEKACPLFVPLVEEGWRKDPVTEIDVYKRQGRG